MTHPLLGDHKPSSNWFTPEDIWLRTQLTFDTKRSEILDPCPGNDKWTVDGLALDWALRIQHLGLDQFIYVNPPTPAAPWAKKALETVKDHPRLSIIYAAFSEAVMWQVPALMDFPVCWVRNRISWIDGSPLIVAKGSNDYDYIFDEATQKYYRPNPNYMKPAKSPRNYNTFVCMSHDPEVVNRFILQFQPLGEVRNSYKITAR